MTRSLALAIVTAAIIAATFVPLGADAQSTPFLYGAARLGERDAPRVARAAATDFSFELGGFSDTVQFLGRVSPSRTVAGALSARARIGPIGIEIDVPGEQTEMSVWAELHLSDPSYTSIGNVSGTVFGVGDLELGRARLTLRAGIGLAGPSASYPARFADLELSCLYCSLESEIYGFRQGLVAAAALQGDWQDYRFYFDGFPTWTVFVPFGVEAWIDRIVFVAVEGILSLHVGEPGVVSAALASAVEAGVEALPFLRLSVRVTGYGELARTYSLPRYYENHPLLARELFQLSAEPRITLAFGTIFGHLGFLLNLSPPWGFGSSIDTYTIWSVRGSMGIRF